ncbi:cholinesterase-like isoform X2 [Dermacentor andersoni]|uniref:cholinesterase-like isoform X2 n=1 Tax=Dermacentor andersoni TaxID=34620 RepID=UPI00241712C3|nr:cholinesterase-like isoform X2 [Dermacentor andersoni]
MAKNATTLLLPVIFATVVSKCYATKQHKVVSTTSGLVRGTILQTTAGPACTFFGIPYAEPPTGNLRFRKPLSKKYWKGVLNATSIPPLCAQLPARFHTYFAVKSSDATSEDCLFLNLFAPVPKRSRLKPVIVYIHGGAFSHGGIAMKIFDASELAVRGDVVVVTVAYRLNAFGFLDMGVEDAPGNMGLYDQLLALRWVKANARAFCGNPDAITLMGQSSGSISVGFHLMWPQSKGLFRRAIMQSGSPLSPVAISTKAEAAYRAMLLTTHLGCDQNGSRKLTTAEAVRCLRSKPSAAILNATSSFNSNGFDDFFPVIESSFISLESELHRNELNARELLAGICGAEGDSVITHLLATISDNDDIAHIRKRSIVLLMKAVMASRLSSDIEPIIEKYFGHIAASDSQGAVYAAADIVTHAQFSCPTVNFVKAFMRPGTTAYVYELSQQPSFIDWPKWVRPTHGDDIVFSLGSTFALRVNATEADVRATNNIIRIVSTFSHSGVPKAVDGVPWPKFDDEERYLRLSEAGSVANKHLLRSECTFWKKNQLY